ncbi:hypothetical protein LSAT2_013649 [Lamellibrachia satsuma]|nr:hypothetical protein LSAT2_013649 [Lamellibrachia satsuma]
MDEEYKMGDAVLEQVKTACDGDLRLHISCPPGTGVHVNSAFYGRLDRTTCPHRSILTTSCSLPGITERVRTMCDDKITCDVIGPFTDPCVGTYKYLKVIYECRQQVKTACDGDLRLHISCPPGTGVHVNSAFYGRLDRTTCPHRSILTTSCSLPGITERVRTMCDDKITCDVIGPFTDPCVGTYKYLKVMYECRRN